MGYTFVNLFHYTALSIPPENTRKPELFWGLQGVYQGIIRRYVIPWCSDYQYCTTSSNKVRTKVQTLLAVCRRFCNGENLWQCSCWKQDVNTFRRPIMQLIQFIVIIIVAIIIIIIIIIKTNSKTWNRLMIERLSFLYLSTMNLSQIFERTPMSSINLFSQQCIQN